MSQDQPQGDAGAETPRYAAPGVDPTAQPQYPVAPQYPGSAPYPGAAQYPGAAPHPGAPQQYGVPGNSGAPSPYGSPTPAWQDPRITPGTPFAGAYAPQPPATPGSYASTNTLAILALIAAFIAPFVVPVVLGHISMSQIRRTGEGGRGLALAALVLGYIQVAFWVLIIAFIIWIGVVAAAPAGLYSP